MQRALKGICGWLITYDTPIIIALVQLKIKALLVRGGRNIQPGACHTCSCTVTEREAFSARGLQSYVTDIADVNSLLMSLNLMQMANMSKFGASQNTVSSVLVALGNSFTEKAIWSCGAWTGIHTQPVARCVFKTDICNSQTFSVQHQVVMLLTYTLTTYYVPTRH